MDGMEQGDADPAVVQQLMFNRILAAVRLLSIDHVTVTGFDPETGDIQGTLAGVNFVVKVSLASTKPSVAGPRGPSLA